MTKYRMTPEHLERRALELEHPELAPPKPKPAPRPRLGNRMQLVASAIATVSDARKAGLVVDDAFLANVAREHDVDLALLRAPPASTPLALLLDLEAEEAERLAVAARLSKSGRVAVELERLAVPPAGLPTQVPITLSAQAREALPRLTLAVRMLTGSKAGKTVEVGVGAATQAVAQAAGDPVGWSLEGRAARGCGFARNALVLATSRRERAELAAERRVRELEAQVRELQDELDEAQAREGASTGEARELQAAAHTSAGVDGIAVRLTLRPADARVLLAQAEAQGRDKLELFALVGAAAFAEEFRRLRVERRCSAEDYRNRAREALAGLRSMVAAMQSVVAENEDEAAAAAEQGS